MCYICELVDAASRLSQMVREQGHMTRKSAGNIKRHTSSLEALMLTNLDIE